MSRVRSTATAVLLAALALLVPPCPPATAAPEPTPSPGVTTLPGPIQPDRSDGATAQQVDVGVYLNRIQSLDLTANSYTADFYVWFRWIGDIDPSTSVTFTNRDTTATVHQRPFYDSPELLPDGSRYQGLHVLAKFSTLFNFRHYPRDAHRLTIEIEDDTYDKRYLVYRLAGDVQYDRRARQVLGGWTVSRSPTAAVTDVTYQTNFGDQRAPAATVYSHLAVALELRRSAGSYLTKSIIPISIVILITILTFWIGAQQISPRLGMCITALISAVLLHAQSTRELPTVGYFVLFDWLYCLAYLLIFASLVESVISLRLWETARESLSRRVDQWTGVVAAVLYLAGVTTIVLV